MSVSMLEAAKSDVGTKLSPRRRAAGSFWKHSEASARVSESPQEQRTHVNPALWAHHARHGASHRVKRMFTWLGGSLRIQGQGQGSWSTSHSSTSLCCGGPGSHASSRAQDIVSGEQPHSDAHHSSPGLGENTHLANRNLLTPHRLFPCSYQPTLILIAKLGARPLGCSLGQCCDTHQGNGCSGSLFAQGCSTLPASCAPSEAAAKPHAAGGVIRVPLSPLNQGAPSCVHSPAHGRGWMR